MNTQACQIDSTTTDPKEHLHGQIAHAPEPRGHALESGELPTRASEAFEQSCIGDGSTEERQLLLRRAMALTPHGPQMNTLQHGEDCALRYGRLIGELQAGIVDTTWPEWLQIHGQDLLKQQIDPEIAIPALIHHDCGKPFTMCIDADGRRHFPGHAEASARIWAQAGGSAIQCALMALDMQLHTCSTDEARALALDPAASRLLPTLLLFAHAEIESNAVSIFGGIGSTSHKIKAKALAKRAKAILASPAFAD